MSTYDHSQPLLQFEAVPTTEHEALLKWLEHCGPQSSVSVVLRRSPEVNDQLNALPSGHPDIPRLVRSSCQLALRQITDAWRSIVDPQSVWSGVRAFPSIGICTVAGPTKLL